MLTRNTPAVTFSTFDKELHSSWSESLWPVTMCSETDTFLFLTCATSCQMKCDICGGGKSSAGKHNTANRLLPRLPSGTYATHSPGTQAGPQSGPFLESSASSSGTHSLPPPCAATGCTQTFRRQLLNVSYILMGFTHNQQQSYILNKYLGFPGKKKKRRLQFDNENNRRMENGNVSK